MVSEGDSKQSMVVEDRLSKCRTMSGRSIEIDEILLRDNVG